MIHAATGGATVKIKDGHVWRGRAYPEASGNLPAAYSLAGLGDPAWADRLAREARRLTDQEAPS
jgi:hypothetical protein